MGMTIIDAEESMIPQLAALEEVLLHAVDRAAAQKPAAGREP